MPKLSATQKMYWKPNDVENALAEVASGVSIRNAAAKYGMSEGTLRFRLKKIRAGESFVGSGKKPVIKKDVEQNIAACIGTLCKLGFSPTMTEVIELVANYISANGLNVPTFKNGKPGRNWFQGFMKRNKLSLKKAEMISAARKAATANPFVIYDFYEQLEEIIKDKKLNANQIWNCDESGFPTDPHKCKVVSVKGKTAYKVTCGARPGKYYHVGCLHCIWGGIGSTHNIPWEKHAVNVARRQSTAQYLLWYI